jgi:hypothetical protein
MESNFDIYTQEYFSGAIRPETYFELLFEEEIIIKKDMVISLKKGDKFKIETLIKIITQC